MRRAASALAPAMLAPLLLAAAPQGENVAPGIQPAAQVPAAFFGNSIACKNEKTGAVCQLWLERDERYRVGFNRGPQALLPSIDGPWQIEAREGRYRYRVIGGAYQLCLVPDGGMGGFDVERAGEPFAGAACYVLPPHAVGDRWSVQDEQGRRITYWLVEGR